MENTSRSRRNYDTRIVWLYQEKKEKLLNSQFRKTIPHSTISTWRNNPSKLYGEEYSQEFRESLLLHELIAEHKRLKSVLYVAARTWIQTYKYLKPVLRKATEFKEYITNAIQRLQRVLSTSSSCRLFSISTEAFHYQLNKLKYACDNSPLSLCFKRHPLQLSQKELNCIKDAFTKSDFVCWPASSIYYRLLRNKELNIGLSTFYKYVHLLGLKRKWGKEKSNTKGVKTTRPNEYLHVDTTYTKTQDGETSAVVFVNDNFSKAILGWEIAPKNSALNIVNALKMA